MFPQDNVERILKKIRRKYSGDFYYKFSDGKIILEVYVSECEYKLITHHDFSPRVWVKLWLPYSEILKWHEEPVIKFRSFWDEFRKDVLMKDNVTFGAEYEMNERVVNNDKNQTC